MAAWTTLWRRVGGLFVALLLVVLVAAPGVDSIVCSYDPAPATAVPGLQAVDARAAPVDASHQDGGPGVCAHGHCHHGAPYLEPVSFDASDGIASAVRLTPPATTAPLSGPTSRLEHPPRI